MPKTAGGRGILRISNEILSRWASADDSECIDHGPGNSYFEDELTAMITGRAISARDVRPEILVQMITHRDIHIATAGLNLVPSCLKHRGGDSRGELLNAVKATAAAIDSLGRFDEAHLLAVIRAQSALLD